MKSKLKETAAAVGGAGLIAFETFRKGVLG